MTALRDEIDLLDGASAEFDLDEVRRGKLTPVFFGSALTNFGVEVFLQTFPEDGNDTASTYLAGTDY